MKSDYVWPYKEGEYELLDFKDTSLYAVKNGAKPEWIAQGNCYRYGMHIRGFNITRMKNVCILKDWSWTDCHVKKIHGYPPLPIVVITMPIWSYGKTESLLEGRIRLFESCKDLPDNKLPFCTTQQRWAKPDRFAVVQASGRNKGTAVKGGSSFTTA
jgi:hypothetical protein